MKGGPNWKKYPSLRHRERFAHAYLAGTGNTREESAQSFLFEVERFSPAVGLWAGMSLARDRATRKSSTWYLGGYELVCEVLRKAGNSQLDRQRVLQDGAWATACS